MPGIMSVPISYESMIYRKVYVYQIWSTCCRKYILKYAMQMRECVRACIRACVRGARVCKTTYIPKLKQAQPLPTQRGSLAYQASQLFVVKCM